MSVNNIDPAELMRVMDAQLYVLFAALPYNDIQSVYNRHLFPDGFHLTIRDTPTPFSHDNPAQIHHHFSELAKNLYDTMYAYTRAQLQRDSHVSIHILEGRYQPDEVILLSKAIEAAQQNHYSASDRDTLVETLWTNIEEVACTNTQGIAKNIDTEIHREVNAFVYSIATGLAAIGVSDIAMDVQLLAECALIGDQSNARQTLMLFLQTAARKAHDAATKQLQGKSVKDQTTICTRLVTTVRKVTDPYSVAGDILTNAVKNAYDHSTVYTISPEQVEGIYSGLMQLAGRTTHPTNGSQFARR